MVATSADSRPCRIYARHSRTGRDWRILSGPWANLAAALAHLVAALAHMVATFAHLVATLAHIVAALAQMVAALAQIVGALARMHGPACSSPRRSVFSGGAKARMTEVEGVRLPSVVRRLRTTDCKRTRSNSTVCAFAPPKKIREISKVAPSPWVT